MANADLKVLKVFTQGNKQIGYEVMRVDGSIIKVSRDQMIQAISLGHSYANATVSDSGVVRVSSDVPREDISVTAKKPTGVLDYKGDFKGDFKVFSKGFLKDGKPLNSLDTWDALLISHLQDNPVIQTKYIPSGVVDKAINRELYKTYIDPAKAYKKYTFHVSVAEAKKYVYLGAIPKIEKFRDEHETDNTTTYLAADISYTSWFDEDMYYGYDTITVWVYVANLIPNLGFADSMIYLSMVNDIMDTMQSRLDDGCLLHKYSLLDDRYETTLYACPYTIIEGVMVFLDERIYKKFMATVARFKKIKQAGNMQG